MASGERIYREASNILEMIEDKKGSLKSLVFAMKMTTRRKKAIYAMVANTIRNKDIINQVIKESQILSLQPKVFHPILTITTTTTSGVYQ
jgi:hypothetical protein